MSRQKGDDLVRLSMSCAALFFAGYVALNAAENLEKLTFVSAGFSLLVLAMLLGASLQFAGILPANVLRPGLDGVANIVAAFGWLNRERSQGVPMPRELPVLDLTPEQVVEWGSREPLQHKS